MCDGIKRAAFAVSHICSGSSTVSCFSLFCVCLYAYVCVHAVVDVCARVFVCVCIYIYRLAEMESQNCSFFTDSLSPDESL